MDVRGRRGISTTSTVCLGVFVFYSIVEHDGKYGIMEGNAQ